MFDLLLEDDMYWSCNCCDGLGNVHDPDYPWWKFWRRVECAACVGSGRVLAPDDWAADDDTAELPKPVAQFVVTIYELADGGAYCGISNQTVVPVEKMPPQARGFYNKLQSQFSEL